MIDKLIEHLEETYEPRMRLGLSQAGHPCPRWIWYKHNDFKETPPDAHTQLRFKTGHALEEMLINELSKVANITCRQQKVSLVLTDNIILQGHLDGILNGRILEIKTANDRRYNALAKHKDYHKWSAMYWWQVQLYMAAAGMPETTVIVLNKNDCNLLELTVPVDEEAVQERLAMLADVLTSPVAPVRNCVDDQVFDARYCSYRNICFF